MQPAPAVSVEWRTGSAWIVAALLIAVAALGIGLLWAAGVGGTAWLLLAASLLLLAASTWPWRPRLAQRLRWDGLVWWLRSMAAGPQRHGEVRLMLDLGAHLLLLRFDAGGPGWRPSRRWLALSRRSSSGDWHGLRCALYCPGVVGVMPAATDPPP